MADGRFHWAAEPEDEAIGPRAAALEGLTEEQRAIVEADIPQGGSLVVRAYAGTGKTFTLQRFAEARPTDRLLYLAYNKAIQLDAEGRMPQHVTSRTTHSLAFREHGLPYQKAGQLKGNVPLWRVAKLLGVDVVRAHFVVATLKAWLASADDRVGPEHIPGFVRRYHGEGTKEAKPLPPYAGMAADVWVDMCSLAPKSLPMTHDGYLKLWALSGPELPWGYILLDEAQDTTPCVWEVIANQRARKIVVGDAAQQIYRWRHACDSLDIVEQSDDVQTLRLSKSWRFGPAVADLATTLLKRFRGETVPVRGNSELRTRVHTQSPTEACTMLARGNTAIFRDVVRTLDNTDRTLGFVGGDHKDYRFPLVADVHAVYSGHPDHAKDPIVRSFSDIEELIEYADKTSSGDLQQCVKLVDEYGGRIPRILDDVRDRDVGARYGVHVYATAHKSKGLEFDVVKLAGDFASRIEAHRAAPEKGIMTLDEVNLLYVAITRAKERLYIHPAVMEFIQIGSL